MSERICENCGEPITGLSTPFIQSKTGFHHDHHCWKEVIPRLRDELAAEKRGRQWWADAAAAEREQKAALAAALEAIRMHVRDQYIHFPGHGTLTIGEYIDKHDTRAILAARDARRDPEILRKGAAWALKRIINQFATEHDRLWFEKMLAAIERGDVEVPK